MTSLFCNRHADRVVKWIAKIAKLRLRKKHNFANNTIQFLSVGRNRNTTQFDLVTIAHQHLQSVTNIYMTDPSLTFFNLFYFRAY